MTQTPNLGLIKPSENDLFGIAAFNQNADIIDDAFGSRSYQIGDIVNYEGMCIPNGWLPCDGRKVNPDEYSDLIPHLDDRYTVDIHDTSRMTMFPAFYESSSVAIGNIAALSEEGIIMLPNANRSTYSDNMYKSNVEHVALDSNMKTMTYVPETGVWIATDRWDSTGDNLFNIQYSFSPNGPWVKKSYTGIRGNSPFSATIKSLYCITFSENQYLLLFRVNSAQYPILAIKLDTDFNLVSQSSYYGSTLTTIHEFMYVEGCNTLNSNRITDTLYPQNSIGSYFISIYSGEIKGILFFNGESFEYYTELNIPSSLEYTISKDNNNAIYIANYNGHSVIAITITKNIPNVSQRAIILIDASTKKYLKTITYGVNLCKDDLSKTSLCNILFPYGKGYILASQDSLYIKSAWIYLKDLDDQTSAKAFYLDKVGFQGVEDFPGIVSSRPVLFKYDNSIYLMASIIKKSGDTIIRYGSGLIEFCPYRLPKLPGCIIKVS